MSKPIHFEEYLYLPALTHDAAIIAWGGFYFEVKKDDDEEEWKLLDDDKLPKLATGHRRKQTIGEQSEAYAPQATVFITDLSTGLTTNVAVQGSNHAIIRGLQPDHEYGYRVVVQQPDGSNHEWAAGPRRDWGFVDGEGVLQPSGKHYENRFRTFPAPSTDAKQLTFAVIGDFGRGVRKASKPPRCQREVAEAMSKAFDETGFRFIVSTGDNIYAKTFLGLPVGTSGDEDDDWFYTYFQPYRYLLNRMPVFTAIGNHDDGESEHSVDRLQIYDNLYLRTQARELHNLEDAEFNQGLFYRFNFGEQIEFVCLDTSKQGSRRCFELPANQAFLERTFATAAPLRWRIPFSHHPARCAGPQHEGMASLRELYNHHGAGAGVRVTFSGHEHNFQYSRDGQMAHFLTGGGGKYRTSAPHMHADAGTQAWGGNNEGHFLLVKLNGDRMEVTPIGHLDATGKLRELPLHQVHASPIAVPIAV